MRKFIQQFNQMQNYPRRGEQLGERWNEFECGMIQRGLYSAFLIMNVKDNLKEIDRDSCMQLWESFNKFHKQEIQRLRGFDITISSMGGFRDERVNKRRSGMHC